MHDVNLPALMHSLLHVCFTPHISATCRFCQVDNTLYYYIHEFANTNVVYLLTVFDLQRTVSWQNGSDVLQ